MNAELKKKIQKEFKLYQKEIQDYIDTVKPEDIQSKIQTHLDILIKLNQKQWQEDAQIEENEHSVKNQEAEKESKSLEAESDSKKKDSESTINITSV